jgi:hypothetical protein
VRGHLFRARRALPRDIKTGTSGSLQGDHVNAVLLRNPESSVRGIEGE